MRDPLVRRLLTGVILSSLFVAAAIRYFGLEPSVALSFLGASFLFVLGLIGVAVVGGLTLRWLRGRRSSISAAIEPPSDDAPTTRSGE
jgi:hypothetical protein